MSASLSQIAEECGVSVSTVSLALRGHPRISAKTKERVRAAAARLDFAPNRSVARVMSEIRARGRRTPLRETLGYVTGDVFPSSHNYERRIFAGAAARAAEIGYGLDRFVLGVEGLTLARLQTVLRARGIRGLVVAPFPEPDVRMAMDWSHLAGVAIGYTLKEPELHRVGRDVMHTMREVFNRLAAAGYRRIGFVMEGGHEERMDFLTLAAFQLHSWLVSKAESVPALVTEAMTARTFLRWFVRHRPDLILTMHQPVLEWLGDAGHLVPEEVGFFAFNCHAPDSLVTGIYPAYESIGATAVEQVVALVEHGTFGPPLRATALLVPGDWCVGGTARLS